MINKFRIDKSADIPSGKLIYRQNEWSLSFESEDEEYASGELAFGGFELTVAKRKNSVIIVGLSGYIGEPDHGDGPSLDTENLQHAKLYYTGEVPPKGVIERVRNIPETVFVDGTQNLYWTGNYLQGAEFYEFLPNCFVAFQGETVSGIFVRATRVVG